MSHTGPAAGSRADRPAVADTLLHGVVLVPAGPDGHPMRAVR